MGFLCKNNYKLQHRCVPTQWPLWLGLIFPSAVIHGISWIVLIFILITSKLFRDTADNDPRCRDAIAIGAIMILFEMAWGLQITALTTDLALPTTAALQSAFIVSSAIMGLITLIYFCFWQIRLHSCSHEKKIEEDTAQAQPESPCQKIATDGKLIASGHGEVIDTEISL